MANVSATNYPLNPLVVLSPADRLAYYQWEETKYTFYERISYIAFVVLASVAIFFATSASPVLGASVAVTGVAMFHQLVVQPYIFDFCSEQRITYAFHKQFELKVIEKFDRLVAMNNDQFNVEKREAEGRALFAPTAANGERITDPETVRRLTTPILARIQVLQDQISDIGGKIDQHKTSIEELKRELADSLSEEEHARLRNKIFELETRVNRFQESDEPSLRFSAYLKDKIRAAYYLHVMRNPYDTRPLSDFVTITPLNVMDRFITNDTAFAYVEHAGQKQVYSVNEVDTIDLNGICDHFFSWINLYLRAPAAIST